MHFHVEGSSHARGLNGSSTRGSTVDIPKDLKKKEKELNAREADLRRREAEVKRREETLAGGLGACFLWNLMSTTALWFKGGDVGAWFFAVLYAFGFPAAYFTCGFLNAINLIGWNSIIGCQSRKSQTITNYNNKPSVILQWGLEKIFFFIGVGFFTLESVISIWVVQQVFMYFRGSGKATEMKKEAVRSTIQATM
ncbi:hypothetical protein K7X08_022927 [Anisodus acutangulus]|uniref:Secretory carrier membrane protein n=1 Tax=Anisodus acutangulus TaxID=402998 RepID=A0A9Q1MBZ7_9SOLA|nr:hypothetical protein K7X08_022927 [Anisodus acutangulus]